MVYSGLAVPVAKRKAFITCMCQLHCVKHALFVIFSSVHFMPVSARTKTTKLLIRKSVPAQA